MDAFDILEMEIRNPSDALKKKSYTNKDDPFDQLESEIEPWYKKATRYAAQVPLGIAEGTVPGIVSNVMNLMGTGEALDPEEIEHIKKIAEREGIPFDEEKYLKGVQQASESFPTVSNIARGIESITGLPLEAKTKGQKLLNLGAMAGKFQPGALSKKGAAAVTAPAATYGLEEAGLPEPVAELAGLAISSGVGGLTPGVDVVSKTKPSGLTTRKYEKLKEPVEVSAGKKEKINTNLETDFRDISEDIISKSPIEKTRNELKINPSFKQELNEKFDIVENLSKQLPNKIHSKSILNNLLAEVKPKAKQGFAPGEYEKAYIQHIKEIVDNTPSQLVTTENTVGKYRSNNKELSAAYDPSKSRITNQARVDAVLAYNRAIAKSIEEAYPKTEFSNLFKETNKKFAEVKDAEAIDKFVDGIFDGSVNFTKSKKFFENENLARPFKRALGEENFGRFQQLMKDMLTTETPYKMIQVAKKKGFTDLAKIGVSFFFHPTVGKMAAAGIMTKKVFKSLMNSMLDKPQLTVTWKKAIDNLKKGNFKQAEKEFETLKGEIEVPETKSEVKVPKRSETIEVEPVKTEYSQPKLLENNAVKKSEPLQKETLAKEPLKSEEKIKKAKEKPKKQESVTEVPESLYTKEDFPTLEEAEEYLKGLEKRLKQPKLAENIKQRSEKDAERLREIIEDYKIKKREKPHDLPELELAKINLEKQKKILEQIKKDLKDPFLSKAKKKRLEDSYTNNYQGYKIARDYLEKLEFREAERARIKSVRESMKE